MHFVLAGANYFPYALDLECTHSTHELNRTLVGSLSMAIRAGTGKFQQFPFAGRQISSRLGTVSVDGLLEISSGLLNLDDQTISIYSAPPRLAASREPRLR